MTGSGVRASILIPTHNRPTTLRLAVQSALAQTVSDIEVIIIGDGVTDALRHEVLRLQNTDSRVVFLDFPKSAFHGEPYRHDAILGARSDAIFYLCDDDLFLPNHVGDLLRLLENQNFVQSLNGFIRASGEMDFYPANLSDPETIAWHLRIDLGVIFNSVSLTGTAHSRSFYLTVDKPWGETPPGQWPDHYQWSKLFSSPELRGATSHRMTALQLPTTADGRDTWSEPERLRELSSWADLVAAPGAQDRIDALVARGAQLRMERDMRTIFDTARVLSTTHQQETELTSLSERQRLLESELSDTRQALEEKLSEMQRRHDLEITTMRSTLSWRITRPLRALRRLFPRSR